MNHFSRLFLLLSLLSFFSYGKTVTAVSGDKGEAAVYTGITVYQEGDKTIEEYRVKGFLYSVKVIPKEGKPYYLMNVDGDGSVFKADRTQMKIPAWKVISW